MVQNSHIEVLFIKLLEQINTVPSDLFSGIGLLLYDDVTHLNQYHCNINHSVEIPSKLHISSTNLIHYLIEISSYQHPLHDGFHFINTDGYLTHVSQFLSPPIHKQSVNIKGQGARTLCSLCGSLINGVHMIGTISSKRDLYLFKQGSLIT